jgi:FMN-dependent NADH-azoreductase
MKDIIVALIALVGTLGGSLSGILVSSKMTNYRIQQLEKKVDKHNNFAEKIPLIQEQLKVANHRIEDLEKEVHK